MNVIRPTKVFALIIFLAGLLAEPAIAIHQDTSVASDQGLIEEYWRKWFTMNSLDRDSTLDRLKSIGEEIAKAAVNRSDVVLKSRGLTRQSIAIRLKPDRYFRKYNDGVAEARRLLAESWALVEGESTDQHLVAQCESLLADAFLTTIFADIPGLSRAQHFEKGRLLLGKALPLAWRIGNDELLAVANRIAYTVEMNTGEEAVALSYALQMTHYAEKLGVRELIDLGLMLQLNTHAVLDTTESDQCKEIIQRCLTDFRDGRSGQFALRIQDDTPDDSDAADAEAVSLCSELAVVENPTTEQLRKCLNMMQAYFLRKHKQDSLEEELSRSEHTLRFARQLEDETLVRWMQLWRIRTLEANGMFRDADELAEQAYEESENLGLHQQSYDIALGASRISIHLGDQTRIGLWRKRFDTASMRVTAEASSAVYAVTKLQLALEDEARMARSQAAAQEKAKQDSDAAKAQAEVRAANMLRESEANAHRANLWRLGVLIIVLLSVAVFLGFRSYLLREKQRDLESAVGQRTKELQAAKLEAETASHAKSEFIGWMNHELRNPLTAVIGFTEVLTFPSIEENMRNSCLNGIVSGAKHLTQLVDRILDYSRVEAAQIEVVKSEFAIDHLIEEVCHFLRRSVQPSTILDVAIDSTARCVVCSDETKLRQALINLISNAIKHTPKGSITVSAAIIENSEVSTDSHPALKDVPAKECSDSKLIVAVSDTGAGIPKDLLKSLFQPFASGNRQLDAKKGTGLGLYITRGLVRCLNGDISVTSKEGVGSTFEFCVPISIVGSSLEFETVAESVFSMSFLVIDDNDLVLRAHCALLEALGATCRPAQNWEAAEDVIASGYGPQIVLTDLNMPLVDGYAVLTKIRSMSLPHSLKVIALSGNTHPQTRSLVIDAGFDDFIEKPLNVQSLRALVQGITGQIGPDPKNMESK